LPDLKILRFLFILSVLTAASFYDAKRSVIPNLLILAGAFPGAFFCGPGFLIRFILAAVCLYPFFVLHLFGAGDIKLCALLIGFIGWEDFLPAAFFSFLFASVPSAVLLLKKYGSGYRSYPAGVFKHRGRIPMAPFFTAGFAACQIFKGGI